MRMVIEQTKEYYRDIVDDFTNEIKILESLKGNKNIVEIKNYEVIEKTVPPKTIDINKKAFDVGYEM